MRKIPLCPLLLVTTAARVQDTLPLVSEVEWKPFKAHVGALLKALNEVKEPLASGKEIQAPLDNPGKDTDAACEKIQNLLAAHCLIAVAINPESCVKAARGPAHADLARGKPRLVLGARPK